MNLQLLLINKDTDETYYSVHIVSHTNATYIHYLIIKDKENIYTKVLEYMKSNMFHEKMLNKGFVPEDYTEFNFTTLTINTYGTNI